jgi:hypothetical protein
LGVNLARIVGDAAAAARPAKVNASVSARPPMSSRRKRGRAHHQPGGVVLDFVNPEFFAAVFFIALRFLVTVLSDLSGCSCVLKALFSKLSRRP